jgi:hypothetical protein
MSYEPPPSPENSTNRTLILVIAILAAVFLVGIAGCAGLGMLGWLFANRTAQMARQEAEMARAAAEEAEARQRIAAEGAAEAERDKAAAMKGAAPRADRAGAEPMLDLFLSYLREDRLDDAYGFTSTVFQKEHNREAFTKFLTDHPGLKQELHSFGMTQPEVPGESVIRYRYVSRLNGPVRVEAKFTLSKENDRWLIDRIEIREDKVR